MSPLRREAAFSPEAHAKQTDRVRGLPHGSIYPDPKHRREWKVPQRLIHSCAKLTFPLGSEETYEISIDRKELIRNR